MSNEGERRVLVETLHEVGDRIEGSHGADAILAALAARGYILSRSEPERTQHNLLFPPHPGDVYQSSALCSCGDWQWDGDSPDGLYRALRTVQRDWTTHAAAPSPEPLPLDVERLARALLEAQERGDHSAACLDTTCPVAAELRDFAVVLAREYAALREPDRPT